MNTTARTLRILTQIGAERERQDAKWGEQNHPYAKTPPEVPYTANYRQHTASEARTACDYAHRHGHGTWEHILDEELAEAYAEEDGSLKMRAELVQVAAVVVAMIEQIDRHRARALEAAGPDEYPTGYYEELAAMAGDYPEEVTGP